VVADCFLSLKARVVRALLEFAKHLGEPTATPGQLPVHDKIRQEALAALANVAGENVSRIMSQWKSTKSLSIARPRFMSFTKEGWSGRETG